MFRGRTRLAVLISGLALVLVACGSSGSTPAESGPQEPAPPAGFAQETLRISAIPDQDPAKLTRLYGLMAEYLEAELDVPVEYVPVADYTAAVSEFKLGDLDLVWFGGLTGVQARLQTPDSVLIAQRDIDEEFTSVFIAGADVDLDEITAVEDLATVAGRTVTFGSESSTSGRLMPQYFLDQAGVEVGDLAAPPGFSGSHDATIAAVQGGAFEVGALNASVWDAAVEAGTVDETAVVEVFRTPAYFDYHWIAQGDLDDTYGDGFTKALREAILGLDPKKNAEVLELFGATGFVPTTAANYDKIEAIARKLELITE